MLLCFLHLMVSKLPRAIDILEKNVYKISHLRSVSSVLLSGDMRNKYFKKMQLFFLWIVVIMHEVTCSPWKQGENTPLVWSFYCVVRDGKKIWFHKVYEEEILRWQIATCHSYVQVGTCEFIQNIWSTFQKRCRRAFHGISSEKNTKSQNRWIEQFSGSKFTLWSSLCIAIGSGAKVHNSQ